MQCHAEPTTDEYDYDEDSTMVHVRVTRLTT